MDKLKSIIDKNKKLFYSIMASIIILLIIIYFRTFFAYGIPYQGIFLKKETVLDEIHYRGKSLSKNVIIVVKELSLDNDILKVSYNISDELDKTYYVSLEDSNDFGQNVIIKNSNDKIEFEGTYRKGSPFLQDKDGEIIFPPIEIRVNGAKPERPKFNPREIMAIVTGENEGIRGDISGLFMALFIAGILLVDIKYPLFFFYLRYSWGVENPQPSDWYKKGQKISRYVMGILIIVMLMLSIMA